MAHAGSAGRGKIMLFDRAEYLARIARAKARMAAAGIDVLFVANPANQFWLTGYDGWSFYTPQMVVLSIDDEHPIWFGRAMDAVGARLTVFMADDCIIPYPDEYVGSRERHPMQYLASIADDRGWGGKANRRRDGRLLLHRPLARDPDEQASQRTLRRRVPAGQLVSPQEIATRDPVS